MKRNGNRLLVTMPQSALPILRIVVPILILGALAFTLDIDEMAKALTAADPILIGAAILAVEVQIVVSALRWRFTSVRLGQPIGFKKAVGEYYLASLLNQVLPGGVAGDAVRSVRSANGSRGEGSGGGKGLRVSVQAVMLERLSGQIALFFTAGLGLLAAPLGLGISLPSESIRLVGIVALVAVLVGLGGWLGARYAKGRVKTFLETFGPAIRKAFWRRGAFPVQASSSLTVVFAYLAAFAACAAAIGQPIGLAATLALVPLVLLSMLMPVSVAGWGLREAAAAALLPFAGMNAESAVAASVLYGLVSLAGALPGLFVVLGWPRLTSVTMSTPKE